MKLRCDVTFIVCVAVALSGCSSDRTGIPTAPFVANDSQYQASGYHLLYSFKGGKDGFQPESGLTDVNGKLYGTTASGGDISCYSGHGCGTVFEVSSNGTHNVLHRFAGYPYDGESPQAGLISVSGNLYGTTTQGGVSSFSGTVYKITTSGDEKIVYTFLGVNDGQYPVAELLYAHGLLFGTTEYGGYHSCYGSFACGTIFSTSLSGTENILHRFTGNGDGQWPVAGLTELNGRFYGTTKQADASKAGTVFEITPSGKKHAIYSFKGGRDGAYPYGPLTVLNGKLYGTTLLGGAYNLGTLFAVSPAGKESIIHAFKGSASDGAYPATRLIVINGELYGTTGGGGAHSCSASGTGCGTVFSISASGREKLLYSFAGGKDGAWPHAGLVNVSGTLYGTTEYGGSGKCPSISGSPPGCGTIFSIAP
jgi:uncharacterized repeat protein (TIGR03803 family)